MTATAITPAIARNSRVLASPVAESNPYDGLPEWLIYLVSAYSQAKISDEVLMVLEDQFSDVTPELMQIAVRRLVRQDREQYRRFPSPGQVWLVVESEQNRIMSNIVLHQMERQQLASELRGRREDMSFLWCNGYISDREYLSFARQLQAAGLEHAAANIRGRVENYRQKSAKK